MFLTWNRFGISSLGSKRKILFHRALNFSADCPHTLAKFALSEMKYSRFRHSMKIQTCSLFRAMPVGLAWKTPASAAGPCARRIIRRPQGLGRPNAVPAGIQRTGSIGARNEHFCGGRTAAPGPAGGYAGRVVSFRSDPGGRRKGRQPDGGTLRGIKNSIISAEKALV